MPITRQSFFKGQKINSLKDRWSDFYLKEKSLLESIYPGLSLPRFLREVKDLLGIDLELSSFSISEVIFTDYQRKFLKGIPFAYLLNEAEFYGLRLYVNKDVLIPRPETEMLVEHIVQSKRKFSQLLDIGTGSGAILFSLMTSGFIEHGTGADISKEALEVARINQRRHRLGKRTKLIQSDRLNSVVGKFDLIVSNPPYIKKNSHRALVQNTVDEFEPHLALYLLDEAYEEWFHDLFQGVKDHLLPGGEFWMEGHEKELIHQADTLRSLGFKNVMVLKDLGGLDRYLRATH